MDFYGIQGQTRLTQYQQEQTLPFQYISKEASVMKTITCLASGLTQQKTGRRGLQNIPKMIVYLQMPAEGRDCAQAVRNGDCA